MKKSISRAVNLAVMAALACAGCADKGIDEESSDNGGVVDKFLGAPVVAPPVISTFKDSRDGKSYRAATIGTQTWMAENLNYDVPKDTTDVCYGNSADSCAKYGRLYSWQTAMDGAEGSTTNPSGVQGACPANWHVPSELEWTVLENYVGGLTGKKLKSTSGWNGSGNGSDDYGFSALPGGGWEVDFKNVGDYGYWWSATGSANNAYNSGVYVRRISKGYFMERDQCYGYGCDRLLLSVRCVRD